MHNETYHKEFAAPVMRAEKLHELPCASCRPERNNSEDSSPSPKAWEAGPPRAGEDQRPAPQSGRKQITTFLHLVVLLRPSKG